MATAARNTMQATNNDGSPRAGPADSAMMSSKDKGRAAGSPTTQRPLHYPFWFGGSASSMAACVTHPLDLGKPLSSVTSQFKSHRIC
jgi:solute carrier family 25 (mitochondrial dicarboxylate transporter), member 10